MMSELRRHITRVSSMAPTTSSSASKPTIACDLDEVLALTIDAIIRFHNATYGTTLTLADFVSYHYWEVWGGDREASIQKIREFYKSKYFLEELEPVPGAYEAMQELKKDFRLVVVTSRQNVVHQQTLDWVAKHFPNTFDEIHFGNAFLSNEELKTIVPRKKSQICGDLGAIALIDDSLDWVEDCLSNGVQALLFDLNFSYGWSKRASKLDKFVHRLGNWEEVLAKKHLLTSQINHFDVWSVVWDDRPEIVAMSNKLHRLLTERDFLQKDKSVMDFGCGTGILSVRIASQAHSVLGVDMSDGMIKVLQQKIEQGNLTTVRALCKELKSPEELETRFDLIVSCVVFHHIDNIPPVVNMLAGMLKPGGSLVVMDLERHPNETELFHPKSSHGSVSHHGISTSDMHNWYKAAGLMDIKIDVPEEITRMTDANVAKSFPLFFAHGRRPLTQ